MKNKVPRKLKKELRKVDCLETSQPSIKMEPNPFSPSKMMFTQNSRVKLKEGVKINKWTKRLVRNILREVRRNHKRNPNDQGFYTSKGRFVTREEGLEIARAAGQVDKIIGGVLTSEDLY